MRQSVFMCVLLRLVIVINVDEAALDRLVAILESLQGLFEKAKDERDPDVLAELLKQCQAGLDQIEQMRAKK